MSMNDSFSPLGSSCFLPDFAEAEFGFLIV